MSDDPWSIYWHQNRLHSCVSTSTGDDSKQIDLFWRRFARGLPEGAAVLDLATGNGAVPAVLIDEKPSLHVSAVDKAVIEPRKYLRGHRELAQVTFFPSVDLLELPFPTASFDAITSQFGIEYAPLSAAAISAARVLRSGGTIAFLLHHQDSEILQPVAGKLAEMSALMTTGGLLASVEQFLEKKISSLELERAGEAYLGGAGEKTAHISGQVFAAIRQVMESVDTSSVRASEIFRNAQIRLSAERRRLEQLQGAALDVNGMRVVADQLAASGVEVTKLELFTITMGEDEPAIIAWQLFGHKK